MKRVVVTLLFVLGLTGAPAGKPELIRAEGSVDAMGSTYSVVIYGSDRDKLQSNVAQALEEVLPARRVEDRHRVRDAIERDALDHAREPEAVIAVKMGDEDVRDLARGEADVRHAGRDVPPDVR